MPETVYEILNDNGPLRSARVVDILIKKNNISRPTARQWVSRAKKPVRRLTGINLPNREKFLYLSNQFGSAEYFEALQNTLIETRTSAGRALQGLLSHNGVVPKKFFKSVSGITVIPTKGQLLYASVKKQLIDIGLINIEDDPVYGELICLRNYSQLSQRQRAVYQAEDIFLSILCKWIANIGMGSFNKIMIRGDTTPSFGPFCWDLVGPSYIRPLLLFKDGKIKNGFVAADILLDQQVSLSDLTSFLFKCDLILAQKNSRPFIGIFTAESFKDNALKELRKRGILIARPETMLGKEGAGLLRSLIGIIEKANDSITNNPDEVFKIVNRLSKLEGAAENLRGMFLEMLTAYWYVKKGYSIDIRKNIKTLNGESAEIDVKAENDAEIICIECKGMAPGNLVKLNELEDWVSRIVPRIKNWLNYTCSNSKNKRFEFWASQGYEPESVPYIKKIEKTHKKNPIKFLSGSDIRRNLTSMNWTSLHNMFRDQFCK